MRSLIKNGDGGGSGEEGSSNTTTTMRSHSASGTTNDNIKDAVLPLRNIKKKQSSGWLTAIVSSIFEPGINDALLFLMHGSFICLIVSLFWMLYLTRANNAHVLICTIIAISLYGVLIWYVLLWPAKMKSDGLMHSCLFYLFI